MADVKGQLWDTTYVYELPALYRINTGFRITNDLARFKTSDGKQFSLQNRNLAFRIGGRYKLASYTFNIPVSDLGTGTADEEGKSWGLGLRLFRRYGFFRTQFRFTDGFRLTDGDGRSTFRSDIKLFTAFVYGYHVLNAPKFSLRSSFNQRDRQLKTAGSWLVGGLANRRRIVSDGLSIPVSGRRDIDLKRFAQTSIGVGGGYAFTQIIKERYFITPLVYAGPELRFTNVQEVGERHLGDEVRLGLQFRARISVGWQGDRYFAALIGDYIPTDDNTDNLETDDFRSQVAIRLGVQW